MAYIKRTSRNLPFHTKKDDSNRTWGKAKKSPYNNRRWKSYSSKFKSINRWCEWCDKLVVDLHGVPTDHIIPLEHDGSFWDARNHQTMHIDCHSSKSAQEKKHPLYKWTLNDKREKIPLRSKEGKLILNK